MDRLLLIHEIVTLSTGALYLAPLEQDTTKRILDIGTGSGVCTSYALDLPLSRHADNARVYHDGR